MLVFCFRVVDPSIWPFVIVGPSMPLLLLLPAVRFGTALSFLCWQLKVINPSMLNSFTFPCIFIVMVIALVLNVKLWFGILFYSSFGVSALLLSMDDLCQFFLAVTAIRFSVRRRFHRFDSFLWDGFGVATALLQNPDTLGSLRAGAYSLAAARSPWCRFCSFHYSVFETLEQCLLEIAVLR